MTICRLKLLVSYIIYQKSMKVLLSIKPEFADKIFNGTKKFEFRRTIFKNKGISTVLVYASSPVQKIIREFQIEEILNERLDRLWESTKHFAGIDKEYFYDYFNKKQDGFAIKIKAYKRYDEPLCIKRDLNLSPP